MESNPSARAKRLIDITDDWLRKAQEADGVEATVFYGDHAITHLLGAILFQLEEIQQTIEKLAKRQ